MREYKSGSVWALWRWKKILLKGKPYLTRLHVLQTPWGAIMIHFIHRADPFPDRHDHPVSFLSLILKGWYWELADCVLYKHRWVNWVPYYKQHRIVEVAPNGVVTLVFASQRKQEWGFYTLNGWVDWRTYTGEKG